MSDKAQPNNAVTPQRPGMRGFGPGHGPGMMGTGGKATDPKATARRLLNRLAQQTRIIQLILLLTAGAVGFGLLGPKLLGDATTLIFEGVISEKLPSNISQEMLISQLRANGESKLADLLSGMTLTPGIGVDFSAVTRLILIVIALYLASALFNWMQGYLMAGVAQTVIFDLRKDVQFKLGKVPIKYIDESSRGDLLSRVTNDIDNVGNTLQQGMSQLVSSLLTVIGTIGIMFYLSPLLALASILIVPISILITARIAKLSQKEFAEQWKQTGAVNGHIEEMHTGHALVLAFGREQRALADFDTMNEALFKASFKASFLTGIMQPLMWVLSNINYVIIAVLGALQVASGQISLGSVQAFIQYSRQFTMPLGQIAAQMNLLQSGIASAERVFEVLDALEEPLEKSGSMRQLESPQGKVEFENISFRYLPEVPLIQNVNLTVNAGETVAIVGPTGAGKTTIVNLLMRFYEIDSGKIKIDGVDTREIAREDLRSIFGMVLQDTWLFTGTIRENIRYGNLNASDEDVYAAARNAHADHFIRTLPLGYDTILDGDSSNISVGERQLLTIARAFVANPAILILDEATSNVDTRTEVLIQQAMQNLRTGRTGFVIAHRLSTIRNADLILVMDKGEIVEQGTHKELLEVAGMYKKLYESQFTN